MKIAKNSKFILQGDSVTDAGRARPVAEGLFNPHGTGYPNIVQGLLTSVYPDYMIRVVNMGVSGNTSRDLKARWKTDTLDLRPDWVSIMIGINDIWRQFDVPQMPEASVGPDDYRRNLQDILDMTKPVVQGIVLLPPVFWELNTQDPMAARAREYGAICRELAAKNGVLFADAQAYADRVLKHCHPAYISWDRVHPNIPGHNVLAHALLDALDFDFNRVF